MRSVSSDVLTNIFCFLTRNDIEKDQLVCRRWRNIVDLYDNLPLYYMENMSIMTFGEDPYTSLTRPNNIRTYMLIDGEFKNTDLIRALKNCVIGVMITRMAKFGTIVTVLDQLSQISGKKLRVASFEPNSHDGIEWWVDYPHMISILQHIQTNKVQKTLSTNEDYESFLTMTNLKISGIEQIQLSTNFDAWLNFPMLNNKRIGDEDNVDNAYFISFWSRFVEALRKRENPDLFRFSLKFIYFTITREGCKALLEIYMTAEAPEYLPKSIIFKHRKSDSWITDVFKDLIKRADQVNVDGQQKSEIVKDKYAITTKKGHKLEITFWATVHSPTIPYSLRIKMIPNQEN